MHKPESIQENETYKTLFDLEIQTNHQIPTRRSYFVQINKKKINCRPEDVAVPADVGMKIKETEKIKKYMDLS